MKSDAVTVKDYLAALPEDRRAAIAAVRQIILLNLPAGYEEGMQYGMIGYYVPHKLYPAGYHCDPRQPLPFAGLASQKNHLAIYLMCIYSDGGEFDWFARELALTGKKLDMGKACIRFKKLSDLPLELIGQAIARVPVAKFISFYEAAINQPRPARAKAAKKPAAKKRAVKKSPVKKSPTKKAAKQVTKKKAAKKKS